MPSDTIPPPHPDELAAAKFGINLQAEAHGVDIVDENFVAFTEHHSRVVAQLNAEIRWLRKMVHGI